MIVQRNPSTVVVQSGSTFGNSSSPTYSEQKREIVGALKDAGVNKDWARMPMQALQGLHMEIHGRFYTFSKAAPTGFNEAVMASLESGSDFMAAIAAGDEALREKRNAAFRASAKAVPASTASTSSLEA